MKKGFTLIELLAVIVILAIIALIAAPIILGIINDAKEDSEKRSIENYAHAVELSVARYASGNDGVVPVGKYRATGKILTNIDSSATPKQLEIDYKGEKIEGDVEITADGQVIITGAKIGNGKNEYDYSESNGVTKNESNAGENNEASSPFKVSDSGVLLHYERQGDETSVVVPAKVGDTEIKAIAPFAFMPGDIYILGEQGLVIGLNSYSESLKDIAEQNGMKFVMIDELGKGNDPVDIPLYQEDIGSGGNGKVFYDPNAEEGPFVAPILFLENYYLTDIDMSEMKYLEVINEGAFFGISSNSSDACYGSSSCPTGTLETVKLPVNGMLKTIGEGAFAFNKITEIILPDTVTTIGDSAFEYNKLTELVIPANLTNIGKDAFFDNRNLTKVTIKGDSTRFDSNWSYLFGSAQKVAG